MREEGGGCAQPMKEKHGRGVRCPLQSDLTAAATVRRRERSGCRPNGTWRHQQREKTQRKC